jgi:Archaeal TRASH domain
MKQTAKTTIIMLSMIFIVFSCQNSEKSTTAVTNAASEPATTLLPHDTPSPPPTADISSRIPTELVCMVNDAFMGRKQFPVPVGNKIYYGCCENCVDKLQKSDKYRYGIDPLTKEKVDKVDAYIVRQSDKNYAVFYFKSKENYEKYLLEKSS